MKFFKGFALAFSMLTIIPFFKVHQFFKGINGYAAMLYPVVGLLLGALLFLIHSQLNPYHPSSHLTVIIFALWILLTGALHLDGVGDTIDGLFVSKECALEVMGDSHIGGMGMIFTFVFLVVKLSAFFSLQSFATLPIILMLSRLNATLAIYFFPYIGGGMGQLAKEELQLWHVGVAFLYGSAIILLTHHFTLVFVSIGILFLIGVFFTKRLGGLSGDIYGFIIELSELAMLEYLIIKG